MIALVRRLWAGDMPLVKAFWDYAILYGLVLNGLTTIAALALYTTDLPAAVGFAVFLLPLPYNLFVLVAVWRSAARYAGPRHWAEAARIVVVWVVVVTLI